MIGILCPQCASPYVGIIFSSKKTSARKARCQKCGNQWEFIAQRSSNFVPLLDQIMSETFN